MTTNRHAFYLNIDKLTFNFDNRLSIFESNKSFEFTVMPVSQSKYYHETISVIYNGTYFGCFLHRNKDNAFNSQFKITNKALYDLPYNDIIEQLFNYLHITYYSMAKLELAVNTNSDLVSKWYTYFKNDKRKELLLIKPKYYEHINTSSFNRVNNINHNEDTIYLKKKRSAIEMRIENKSVEIQTKIDRKEIDKTYILRAYSPYLDVSKDIYRMEMTIDFKKLRAQNHRHCYSKLGNPFKTIPKAVFEKLTDYKKKQYHLVDSKLPKAIPLALLRDQDFLFSFFAEYSVFDYKKIMGATKPDLLKLSLLQPLAYVITTSTITQYSDVDDKVVKYHLRTKSTINVDVDLNLVPPLVNIKPKGLSLNDFLGL